MKKIFKVFGISIATVIALLFIIPYLIPKTINEEITKVINKNIKGEVSFNGTGLSFFSHFPSLTLDLDEFLLKGSAPYENDTLLYTQKLSLGVNVLSLFSDQIKVDKFYINDAKINVQVDKDGKANYNVYESATTEEVETKDDSGTAIKIEGIYIKNADLVYNDRSIPMTIDAKKLNYTGTGDLSNAIFDLKSNLKIEDADFYYDGTPYLMNKKLNAKLITKINTNSLELLLNENNLKINTLPISFVGRFAFIKDGYDLNFKTTTKETDLENIFSALPPEIAEKLGQTKVKGFAEIDASLIGQFIASTKTMPSLTFNLKVRDGNISNPKAPQPVSNLHLSLFTKLPSLNPDSLTVNLDSLHLNIGKDFFTSKFRLNGVNKPTIFTKTSSNIDLQNWAKALNLEGSTTKGRLTMNIDADGTYTTKVVKSGLRKVDTVIATIPKFDAKIKFSNGYFKYPSLPAAIDQINFDFHGQNSNGDYKNTILAINDINVTALSNYIKGYVKLQTTNNITLDVGLKTAINFADIKNFYPVNDLILDGKLALDITSKGAYDKKKKLFPVTLANIKLNNGYIKTANFSEALEKINIDATVTNNDGTLKGTRVNIRPISFEMANQPFLLKANISNFENLKYDVASRGSIDIGKLYKVFAIPGYQVQGVIYTHVNFQGLQSDALSGHLARLNNRGVMTIKDLNILTDMYPQPFIIKDGRFSFTSNLLKFTEFVASYGESDFKLNGNLNNYVNFVFDEREKLTGAFTLTSNKLVADEFMAYANDTTSSKPTTASGVIIIPTNINVTFNANAKNVLYNGVTLKNAKGRMLVNNGKLSLEQTGFNVAGADVLMDASYASTSPTKAVFDFKLEAKEFDIARAYKEIKLFREMATSASKVKGIVGLNYQLSGKLNDEMYPILPSVKGQGELTLRDVKLAGFKMMNAVSKATDRDSLTNPNLKDVVVKTSIKNNIMTIERTKMKIAGFRPRFEGQVSLDGKLNLKGRLGLPPFGLFGIPLSVTGTQENPIIKLKRNKDGKLEETGDDDDAK